MIVIEGKAGKSRVLQDIINNRLRNRSVSILDTVGVRGLVVPEGVIHFMLDTEATVEDVVKMFLEHYIHLFSGKDWIVFEVNANILEVDLGIFKRLDREYTQNFIITVQNNDLEEINVYYA